MKKMNHTFSFFVAILKKLTNLASLKKKPARFRFPLKCLCKMRFMLIFNIEQFLTENRYLLENIGQTLKYYEKH